MNMREQACATAARLAEEDPSVAIILGEISLGLFGDALSKFPDRVIDVGIMEQTMIGLAAGFALEGFHPIVHTIAPFLVERPFEQLKLDFGYQGLGGTFISVGASYDYASEGPTHHSPGDVGVLLTIPEFEILVPGHPAEVEPLMRATYADGHPTYLRTSIRANASGYDARPGSLEVIGRGTKATVLAFGPMLDAVIEATGGLDVDVLYATSIRPFDASALASVAAGKVIAIEPFLEGTVAHLLMKALAGRAVEIHCIGVGPDRLTSYGGPEENDAAAGLDVPTLRRRITEVLAN